jgi:hypothetical protein
MGGTSPETTPATSWARQGPDPALENPVLLSRRSYFIQILIIDIINFFEIFDHSSCLKY